MEALGPGEKLDSLRLVYLGGDRVGWSDYGIFLKGCRPEARFAVHLSSTECATAFLQWFVKDEPRAPGVPLPVGLPLPERAVALLDERGQPVADGEVGEFAVTSRYVALGYWREPELSAQAFLPNPGDLASRTFRTGDLAGGGRTDCMQFAGRKDDQIKLHGYRIEPGGIENALREIAVIGDAAIVIRRDAWGRPRSMIAYVELRPGFFGIRPRHVLAMAGRSLAPFMMPALVFILPELPRMPNLKLDRARLAEIDAARRTANSGGNEISAVTLQLIKTFERVTGMDGATPDDNLWSLGGNSLQAAELALELERQLTFDQAGIVPRYRKYSRSGPEHRPEAPATGRV